MNKKEFFSKINFNQKKKSSKKILKKIQEKDQNKKYLPILKYDFCRKSFSLRNILNWKKIFSFKIFLRKIPFIEI